MNSTRPQLLIVSLLVCLLSLCPAGCGGENVFPPDTTDGSAPVGDDSGGGPTPDQGAQKPPTPPPPGCNTFEHPFQGHCYSVVGLGRMDYDSAAKLCANHKARVASILSPAENDFIYKLLDVTTQAAWIGLRRNLSGTFGWVDGSAFKYNKWAPGEPSSGAERCAVIWGPGLSFPGLRGRWNDAACAKPARDTVICKR